MVGIATASGPRTATGSPVAHWSLIGLETIVGSSAVYGGAGLMLGGLGMPVEWLDGTLFDSWVLPGVFLLAVVAAPMLVAAVAELTRRSWAFAASLAAGALQVGWIVVQLAVIQRYFVLQPVMLGAGVLIVVLAWWAHRGEPMLDRAAHGHRTRP